MDANINEPETKTAKARFDCFINNSLGRIPGTLTSEDTIADDWSPKGPVELKSRVEIM